MDATGKTTVRGDALLMRLAAALVIAALAFTFWHVWSGQPPGYSLDKGPVEQERIVRIESDLIGAATIRDRDGRPVVVLDERSASFVNMMQRSILFERNKKGADPGAAIIVRQTTSGAFSIFDPATSDEYDLSSYGRDNYRVFANLLCEPADEAACAR